MIKLNIKDEKYQTINSVLLDNKEELYHIFQAVSLSRSFKLRDKTPEVIRENYDYKLVEILGELKGFYFLLKWNDLLQKVFLNIFYNDLIIIKNCLEYVQYVLKESDVMLEGGSKMSLELIKKIDKFLAENEEKINKIENETSN